jgi:hypothetical protein
MGVNSPETTSHLKLRRTSQEKQVRHPQTFARVRQRVLALCDVTRAVLDVD